MKVKDLIAALQNLSNQDAEIVIDIKQHNKVYGVVQLPVEHGSDHPNLNKDQSYSSYLNTWVTNGFGASITVHLPKGAYVAGIKN